MSAPLFAVTGLLLAANSVGAWPYVVVLGLMLLAGPTLVVWLMTRRLRGELALGTREVVIGADGVEINMALARGLV